MVLRSRSMLVVVFSFLGRCYPLPLPIAMVNDICMCGCGVWCAWAAPSGRIQFERGSRQNELANLIWKRFPPKRAGEFNLREVPAETSGRFPPFLILRLVLRGKIPSYSCLCLSSRIIRSVTSIDFNPKIFTNTATVVHTSFISQKGIARNDGHFSPVAGHSKSQKSMPVFHTYNQYLTTARLNVKFLLNTCLMVVGVPKSSIQCDVGWTKRAGLPLLSH